VDVKRTIVKELISAITITPCRPGPFTLDGVEVTWRA
jgi:hypothetical protein